MGRCLVSARNGVWGTPLVTLNLCVMEAVLSIREEDLVSTRILIAFERVLCA